MVRKLAPDHIEKMKKGRAATRTERNEALRVVTKNRQFTSASFWAVVDFDLGASVATAIKKAHERRKAARIKELEAELASLKAE